MDGIARTEKCQSLPLFERPETSDAAATVATPTAAVNRERIAMAFEIAGRAGMTDEEGQKRTGIGPNSYRPRRLELERASRVTRTRQRRKTASGAYAVVFVLSRWAGIGEGHQ